jgi:hypothetical protein
MKRHSSLSNVDLAGVVRRLIVPLLMPMMIKLITMLLLTAFAKENLDP